MEELRRELGETRFAKERLEVESRSVHEISDKRKKALDDALAKLQEKKLQVEKQAEELNKRAEDIDVVSLFRHQVAELQECNRQLDGELSILRRDHKATVNELAYMKDEVDQLQKELEQKEVEERETNSLISQIKEQLASALQTVCNQDTDILGLKEDLIFSQAQIEELIAAAGSSENIASELLDKLQLSEDKTTILEKQVV
jgi:chromosome segregation ATPase